MRCWLLAQLEGFAVGALIHSWVMLVCSHRDAVQRTIILILTMVGALFHSAADAMVRFAMIHHATLLYRILLFRPFIKQKSRR